MKILFFIERLGPGGKERRLVELIKNLSKVVPDIEIQLVLTQKEIHYKEILKLEIKIHYLLRGRIKKDPRIFFGFYKIAKKFKPDMIHVWGNMVAFYAIPAKIFLNIPLLNNQITDAPLEASRSFVGPRTTFKFSDKIIANSYAGIEAYNAPLEKRTVIYNGFDFNRIKKLEDKNIIKERFHIKTKFVIAMVATFYEKKDYETYLKAADIILKEKENVTFLCIGAGDSSEYKAMIKPSHKEKILFLGKQSNVESIMNICDIGVLCTITEGISNSLLEFMSLQKPIAVTGAGGCIELIENNKNGFLFDQGEYQQLSNSILELLNNQQLRKKFGEKSRSIVQEKFSIKKMTDDYQKLYKEFANT